LSIFFEEIDTLAKSAKLAKQNRHIDKSATIRSGVVAAEIVNPVSLLIYLSPLTLYPFLLCDLGALGERFF
jgi:hypothetical protein